MKPIHPALIIPRKPIPPNKESISHEEIGNIELERNFSYQNLKDAIVAKCFNFDIEKVRFELVGDDFYCSLYAYLPVAIPNPAYEQQQKIYEQDLIRYEQQLKDYDAEIERRTNASLEKKLKEARKTVKELEEKLKETK
jgi:hypothetical protein